MKRIDHECFLVFRKMSDGLFLRTCRKIAENYPNIEFEEKNLDSACLSMVQFPNHYDVLVMPNVRMRLKLHFRCIIEKFLVALR